MYNYNLIIIWIIFIMNIEIYKKSIAVIDTSAMMKNVNIIEMLISIFDKVFIPKVCVDELTNLKNKNRRENKGNNAWLALLKIGQYKNIIYQHSINRKLDNDNQIIEVASLLEQETHCKNIYIISDDIDFKVRYNKTITPGQILTLYNRHKSTCSDNKDQTKVEDRHTSANALAKDGSGNTLLIAAIRAGDFAQVKKLIAKGADINMTDSSKYFLTPLSHAIQKGYYDIFDYLICAGADINKGSINEEVDSHIRVRNEGNTPLMIACWHNRKRFVERLLKEKDLCLNQQDSNGYTALIKCAIKKNKELFDLLMSQNRIDPLIRDRKNRDALRILEDDD